jgi:hypothetical protein
MAAESEIGIFTPEQARMLWQDFQTRRQLQPKISQNFPQRREAADVSPHRVFVKNTGDEVIPAYACMQITGVELVGGVTAITVEKPITTTGEYLFNSQFEIAVESPTETGVGWAYRYGVVLMLGDEPTEAGDTFQPIVGSWEIEEEPGGPFVVFGRHDANDRVLIGRFSGGTSGGGTFMWFTVDELVCPGDDPYNFPSGGLIVTPTYSDSGTAPPGDEAGVYHVYDYLGILEYSIDAKDNIEGSKGRASYGAEIGTSAFQWILDSINVAASCAGEA